MHHFTKRHFLGTMLALGLADAGAQTYPTRPIKFVVPFAAGSTTDQTARFLGQHVSERTKQPVVVENKAGANGFIGVQYALSQPADGYTVLITTSTTHASNPNLFKKLPYDAITDFIPISGISLGGQVLAVSPSLKVETVRELIALATQRPGKLSFGSGSSWTRAGGELFKEMAKVDILHVPYKSMSATVTDIIGGQVDMAFGDALAIMPHVRSGKLRALGVSTPTRLPGLESIPTIAEQGLPGYEMLGWVAAFAPKGTPGEAVDRLHALITSVVKTPEAAQLFGTSGWRPMPTTRQELADVQKADIERWGRIVRAAGIEPE
jgi:tripartite-type tricarboxylate transporter receptor subunit TctC